MSATTILFILLGLLAVLIFWVISIYNGLVQLRNQIKNAFAQIDVQLKRRYDLIPNLVETAKSYMAHERETLEAVTMARNAAASAEKRASENPADPSAIQELIGAESALKNSLGRFTMTMEAYPDLKANTSMNQLMEELSSTENKISFARQAYNDAVLVFNNKVQMFPSSLIAGSFNFIEAKMFEVEAPEERKAVKVSF